MSLEKVRARLQGLRSDNEKSPSHAPPIGDDRRAPSTQVLRDSFLDSI